MVLPPAGGFLGLEEAPHDGGVDGGLGHFKSEQAQAFTTPLAMAAHPQRAGPYRTGLCDVLIASRYGTGRFAGATRAAAAERLRTRSTYHEASEKMMWLEAASRGAEPSSASLGPELGQPPMSAALTKQRQPLA